MTALPAVASAALLATGAGVLWYSLPLAVVVSLVYSASRYEMTDVILHRATRLCLTILACMVSIFVLLYLLSSGL
ncbi:MAG: hypothetical protein KDA79_08460 [Planctomycetaceae bacterium]|nr:hypothetical protein [Planctomycetaceae bacterium]